MKKIINAIRDFIYNITDYGLIITVIVIMALILGWRFDILFNRGIDKEVIHQLPQIIEEENEPDTVPDSDDPDQTNEIPQGETPPQSGLIATITIPDGSFPSSIGDILLNSNLINDKDAFLTRSVELGLDTKLRSGTYNIEVGTSLDDIIKIIANAY
ncbi:MAG: hypothetical protein WBJ13_09940 [Sedimentibacter sp.]